MTLRTSDHVPYEGITAVDVDTDGVRVERATVTLHERVGPTPTRYVTRIHGNNGATYVYTRYGRDEPLVFWKRITADGDVYTKRVRIPDHVEAVREAIEDGLVRPRFEAFTQAKHYVERVSATDDEVRAAVESIEEEWPSADAAVRSDGGEVVPATDATLERRERQRHAEHRLRDGYYQGGDS